MEKLEFAELLENFGVPLTVFAKVEKGGSFVKGEWVPNKLTESDGVKVTEPFLPSSIVSQLPSVTEYRAAQIEKYAMIWFSTLDVPLKSIVRNEAGQEFSVEDKTSFFDYSDVAQYGLKAVSISESRL